MKKQIFVISILVHLAFTTQAQQTSKLYMVKNFWGTKFYKGDSLLSVNGVLQEMAPFELPYNQMLLAKKDFAAAQVLGAVGGVLIGWPIGTALVGGQPKWYLAGIGAGIIVISLPISANFTKKAKAALASYNQLNGSSAALYRKPVYRLGFHATSVRLTLTF